jgi:hypothetical protein
MAVAVVRHDVHQHLLQEIEFSRVERPVLHARLEYDAIHLLAGIVAGADAEAAAASEIGCGNSASVRNVALGIVELQRPDAAL